MIKIKNLSVKFAEPVLEEVSLEIPAGRIVALIGKNGSGKSTLANVLVGLKADYSGEVWLDDLKLSRHTKTRDLRAKIGLVLQNPDHQLLFNSVREELLFVLQNLQGRSVKPSRRSANLAANEDFEQRIITTLEAVGMADFIDRDPQTLSGGQRQRIAIATMLVAEPDYLILDEVTSQLDQEGKLAIYRVMRQLKKQGVGILMITNNLDELIHADEALVIHEQKIAKLSHTELVHQPKILEQYGLEVPLTLRLASHWNVESLGEIELKLDESGKSWKI